MFGATTGVVIVANLSGQVHHDVTLSRAETYESLDQLIADSSIAIEGHVVGGTAGEIPSSDKGGPSMPTTVALVEIASVVPLTGASTDVAFAEQRAGDVIRVVQLGTTESGAEYPFLRSGVDYLLFLTASNRSLAEKPEYFVTGVWAGMFQKSRNGYSPSWKEGDTLPDSLTIEIVQSTVGAKR